MPSFIRPTYKIVMEEFSSWRPCLGCFHSSRRSSPTADIKDRNLRKRLQKFCRISTLKSSNAPIGSADLWSCPNAGSSSAPSHGSIAADGSPRIGRTSTERRSRSCASHQSASCSENSAIRPELSGQTLRTLDLDRSPRLFKGSLDLLGLVPRYALNDVPRCALDEILRFLQPEAREGSDFPDDFELHRAGVLENDRELALFLRLSDLRRGFSDSIIVPL